MKKQQKLKSDIRYNMDMEHYKAMGKLDSMLVTLGGGRNGYWDPRDHDGFLRIWTQYVLTNRRLITDVVIVQNTSISSKSESESSGSGQNGDVGGDIDGDVEGGPDTSSKAYGNPTTTPDCNHNPDSGIGSITVVYNDIKWILPTQVHKTLLKRIPLVVLGKNVDEINDHIKWYLHTTLLQLEKKALLSLWKRNKIGGVGGIGGKCVDVDDVDSYLQSNTPGNGTSGTGNGSHGTRRSATPSGLSRRSSNTNGTSGSSGSITDNTEDERELTRLRVKMWREEKAQAAERVKLDEETQKRLEEQKKYEQVWG